MSDVDNAATNIYGIIVSAIGILAIAPVIWKYIRSQLPMAKLRELEEALVDTESLLRSVVEEGLLDPARDVPHFQAHIQKFRSSAERFREETYMATDLSKQLAAWFDGLSTRISVLATQVRKVRANICETSVEARMQLMQQQHPFSPLPVPLSRWARLRVALRRMFCCVRTRSVSANRAAASAQNCTPAGDFTALSLTTSDLSASPVQSPVCYNVDKEAGHLARTRRTACPRDRKSHMRALVRAIRRVDQDLASQGVTHPVLKHMVQVTNQRRSSVSSKASHTRRSRRSYSLLFSPSTVEQVVVLPLACDSSDDPQSDEDSWEEETVCDVADFVL